MVLECDDYTVLGQKSGIGALDIESCTSDVGHDTLEIVHGTLHIKY